MNLNEKQREKMLYRIPMLIHKIKQTEARIKEGHKKAGPLKERLASLSEELDRRTKLADAFGMGDEVKKAIAASQFGKSGKPKA